MDRTFDVIVVGGGVVGSAAAYHAAKAGAATLLLEQFRFLHRRGSSHGESRITRLTYPTDTYASLTARALASWRQLEDESGATLYTKTGGIDLVATGSEVAMGLAAASFRNKIPLTELSADEISAFGLVLHAGTTAFYQAESGVLHATTAVSTLQALAAKHGATLRDRSEVTAIFDAVDPSGVQSTVVTRDGRRWSGRRVIVAPGAWAAPLLRSICGIHIELQVVQTTVLYFRANAEYASAAEMVLRQPVVVDYGGGSAWTSTRTPAPPLDAPLIYSCPSLEFPGLIKYAVHAGTVTTATERTFVPDSAATIDPVRRWLRRHAPFVNDEPVLSETCLYTNSPDEDFVVDCLPRRPHIVIAAGFSGHGFKFAPLIGEAAAELALAGRALFDLSAFRLSRPALGLTFVEGHGEGARYKL